MTLRSHPSTGKSWGLVNFSGRLECSRPELIMSELFTLTDEEGGYCKSCASLAQILGGWNLLDKLDDINPRGGYF